MYNKHFNLENDIQMTQVEFNPLILYYIVLLIMKLLFLPNFPRKS